MAKNKPLIVNPADFLMHSAGLRCIEGHDYKTHNIQVCVIGRNGKPIWVKAPGGYCSTCNKYYVTEYVYQKIVYKGIPLCRAITINDNIAMLKGTYSDNSETLLHSIGYNVSDKCDYSDKQRQAVLSIIVKEGIIKKEDIISHLQYLVRRSEHRSNMQMACGKWNRDIAYLQSL